MNRRHYGKRFFIGWITSSLAMFGLTYVFHGLILNDYSQITYPFSIYLTAAAFVYLFIGLIVSRAFMVEWFDKISRHPVPRGLFVGFLCGILVYLIATVVHVTFTKSTKEIVLDVTWQGVEQAFGGMVVGLVYMFVFEPRPYFDDLDMPPEYDPNEHQ